MDTNEYLFKVTIQKIKDEHDRRREEEAEKKKRLENALLLLADRLEFLSNYGFTIYRDDIYRSWRPSLSVRLGNIGISFSWDNKSNDYYLFTHTGAEPHYKTTDDVIVMIAECYQNKTLGRLNYKL